MTDIDTRLKQIRDLILVAQDSLDSAKRLILAVSGSDPLAPDLSTKGLHTYEQQGGEKIIEGVFTGESMLGSDGNIYPVPQNYASKSLLVQGSKLKAIISPAGKIIYKIIKEIEYEVKKGVILMQGEKYLINAGSSQYHVLGAAVTFHKCAVGDTVSIRIPKGKDATYAVIESLLPKS